MSCRAEDPPSPILPRGALEQQGIRPATVNDLDAIMGIEQMSFANPWPRSVLASEIEDRSWSRVMLCERDGVTAGFMVYWLVGPELHLLNLAVDQAHRRAGVGRRLVEHLVTRAHTEAREEVVLEVRVSNSSARKLYQSQGFIDLGIRPRYYADNGEDALVMTLKLDTDGS